MALKQTVVTLAAGVDQAIAAASANRRYLGICNVGLNRATLGVGVVAVADQGWPLSAAAVAGDQGGGLVFEGTIATDATHALHAISAAGTVLVVLEGF